jgi:hypothetical protein
LYLEKSFNLSETQAMTIETLEEIRTSVFIVAIGTLNSDAHSPKEPGGAASLKKIYAENKPPKSITSEDKKIQIPNFEFISPVSSRSLII